MEDRLLLRQVMPRRLEASRERAQEAAAAWSWLLGVLCPPEPRAGVPSSPVPVLCRPLSQSPQAGGSCKPAAPRPAQHPRDRASQKCLWLKGGREAR